MPNCFGWSTKRSECGPLIKTQPGCGTVECPFYKPDKDLVRKEKYNPKTKKVEVTFEEPRYVQ